MNMKNRRILTLSIIHYKADNEMLKRCLESIKLSAFKHKDKINIDIIHAVNGKEINWEELLSEYKDFYIRVFNNKNTTCNLQNQLAIEVCDTEYWTVVDDDDELEHNSLNLFFDEYEKYKNKNIDCFRLHITKIKDNDRLKTFISPITMNHAKFYRMEVIRNNNLYFHENVLTGEDMWFGSLFDMYAKSYIDLNIPFYLWKETEGSITFNWKKDHNYFKETMLTLMDKFVDEYLIRNDINLKNKFKEAYIRMSMMCQENRLNDKDFFKIKKRFDSIFSELTVSVIHYKADTDMLTRCIESIRRSANRSLSRIKIDIIHGNGGKEVDWDFIKNKFFNVNLNIYFNEKSTVNFQNQLAIEKCDSLYWTVVDDDDELYPFAIDNFFKQHNPKENIDCYNLIINKCKGDTVINEWGASMVMNHSKIYKTEVIKNNKLYFHDELTTNEDAWFGTLFMCSQQKQKNLNILFYKWIENEGSITDGWRKNPEQWRKINELTIKLLIDEYIKRKNVWNKFVFERALLTHISTAISSGCKKEDIDTIYDYFLKNK